MFNINNIVQQHRPTFWEVLKSKSKLQVFIYYST